MSWGTCYKGSNNIHFNFPPLMNDGRNFSSYKPGTVHDQLIKSEANIKTNSDYRYYLQNNADTIIKKNQLLACDECSTCPYINNQSKETKKKTENKETNSPYIFSSTLSNDQPYGYENSDLKNIYLSRLQLNAKMYLPEFNIHIEK